jgi:phosphoribosylanthranilate isomerase
VDAILLDSGNPNLSIKELGGTGRTHNWELSREIRKAIPIPLFLAGGLNKNNVRQAIETVQPFGLDLCSSVRTKGQLDQQKLKDFFNAIGH